MKTEIYEHSIVVKLFHNKSLQDRYLPVLLGIFSNKNRRLILFIMNHLHKEKINITIDNIILNREIPIVKKFMNKIKLYDILDEDTLVSEVMDMSIDSSKSLFEESYNVLHDEAFARYVDASIADFKYEIAYKNRAAIIAKVRSIQNTYNIIYSNKAKDKTDQLLDTMNIINSSSAYMPTSSKRLTSVMGGWSKGYSGTAIGRPSHNKSTWFTYDSTWQIKSGSLDEVHVIGVEENPTSFWRRVFAIELGIPISDLVNGIQKISEQDLQLIKKKYEGKIIFHPIREFWKIIELLFSIKVPYIWIDHINAIVYPSGDMYNGIIKLLNYQKDWLSDNPGSVIVNLSQVNTKTMKYKNRLFPSKEDAYMSSVLEQYSREFISFYYPYKDSIDKDYQRKLVGKGINMSQDFIQISIEKNSLGDIGVLDFKYHYRYGKFEDLSPKKEVSNIIIGNSSAMDLFS